MIRPLLGIGSALVALMAITTTPAGARDRALRAPKERACVLDCRADVKGCELAAVEGVRMCREQCVPLADAARQACAADDESAECQTARDALRACRHDCKEPFRSAIMDCRADRLMCRESCPDRVPPDPGDRGCLLDCRVQLHRCKAAAQTAGAECAVDCGDLADALGDACAGPRPNPCREARRALRACLQPCRDGVALATATCLRAASACGSACSGPEDPAATLR